MTKGNAKTLWRNFVLGTNTVAELQEAVNLLLQTRLTRSEWQHLLGLAQRHLTYLETNEVTQ